MAIVVNKPIPEFEASATGGTKVTQHSHHGKTLVLYFYPKDNTPGCTTENIDFSALAGDFAKAGTALLGISKDPPKKHAKFIAKHSREVYDRRAPFAAPQVMDFKAIERIKPSAAEVAGNPRSRSAILRVAERLAASGANA